MIDASIVVAVDGIRFVCGALHMAQSFVKLVEFLHGAF